MGAPERAALRPALAAALAAALALAACGGGGGDTSGGTTAPPARPADSFPAGAVLQLTVAPPTGTAFADSALVAGEAPTATLALRAADGTPLALPDTLTVGWASTQPGVLAAPVGTAASGVLSAVAPGTAQLTAAVTLRRGGAATAVTATVTRAVRAESLTVFALSAPTMVRTNRRVAVTLDVRGLRGTPIRPADLALSSSAPAVLPAPALPAANGAPTTLALTATAGASGGTVVLTASAFGRRVSAAVAVSAPPVPIELVFEAGAPQALQDAFRQAANRWEDLFTAALPAAGSQAIPVNACGLGTPGVTGSVPGIRVFVFVAPDSTLRTAAAVAAPCGGGSAGLAYGARPVVMTILGAVRVARSPTSGTRSRSRPRIRTRCWPSAHRAPGAGSPRTGWPRRLAVARGSSSGACAPGTRDS